MRERKSSRLELVTLVVVLLLLFLMLSAKGKGYGVGVRGPDIFLVMVEPTRCDLTLAGGTRRTGCVMRGDEEPTVELILLVLLVLRIDIIGGAAH
jgi:hypothetical protein